jgi:hypothetical protein
MKGIWVASSTPASETSTMYSLSTWAAEEVRVHDLEGAAAIGFEVDRLVDGAHAARSEAADDAVAAREDRALL